LSRFSLPEKIGSLARPIRQPVFGSTKAATHP
jgi:hypothetical protein